MSWGNPEPVAPATQPPPSFVICQAALCKNQAFFTIRAGGEDHSSCIDHATSNETIVGVIAGVPFSEAARDRLLTEWDNAKAVLERAKASEMVVRQAVASYVFPNATEGMNNHELGGGYVLKLGHKLNYNLTAPNDEIDAIEEEAAKLGNEGTFLIERIITWKANFSVGEYKKLDKSLPLHVQVKALVDKALEIKSGAPSLEIKPPKATLNG